MKLVRAIAIGTGIWGLGVGAFVGSFFIPIMEDPELQANLVLFVVVMPLVGLGTRKYYQGDDRTHGLWVGITFFGVAAFLDALITVPLLVVPEGGSHATFFSDPGFWIIGLLFLSIPTLYWYLRIKNTTEFI